MTDSSIASLASYSLLLSLHPFQLFQDLSILREARVLFASEYVRVYACIDVVGVELGGALKNIFAIAAGDSSLLMLQVVWKQLRPVHAYMHMYIHKYIHTYIIIFICMHTCIQINIQIFIQTNIPTYKPLLSGVAEGLGLGMNTTALLVTRGCKEMARLALALGAKESTLRLFFHTRVTWVNCFITALLQ